jgi:hypothetical protein
LPPEFLTPEKMRAVVKDALAEFTRKDMDLLHLSVHEQTLAHRLAIYIEHRVKDWHVDCEYNRDRLFPKMRLSGLNRMTPDIIVHRRNSPINLLAVEIKKTTHPNARKIEASERIEELTGAWTKMPRYCHGVVMTFPVRRTDRKEVECKWYHGDGCRAAYGGPPRTGTVSVPLVRALK